MNDELKKRSWAEVNLGNIRHNYQAIRASLPSSTRFLGVVKADAYGHGALPVAKALESAGADYLAVACLDEALELRRGGIEMPILILGHTPPEYTDELIENRITQAVSCLIKARQYSQQAVKLGGELKIHIKLDTGMSRLGFICAGEHFSQALDDIEKACALPGLVHEGIFTHFAVSDEEGEENEAYTREQFRRFTSVIEALGKRGVKFDIRHCANTGATLYYKEMALDMVRPGLLLYGFGDRENALGLRPCMSLKTRVCTVKEYDAGTTVSYGRHFETQRHTRMGVLPVGYADGLPRLSSNKCSYLTAQGPAPQRGSICMDMCMVDLTELPDIVTGSEVEIFGENNSVCLISDAAQTIPYEVLCAVSKRIPRIYKEK